MQNHFRPVRRERNLLLIAAAFLMTGSFTLATANLRFPISKLLLTLAIWGSSFTAAHLFLNRCLPHRDPFLLPVGALLSGWGLLLIGRLANNFLLRQAIWLLISIMVFLIVIQLGRNLRWLRRFRYTWLFGGLILLLTTLIFGVNPSGYGPRLWLGVWGVYFQPSEPLKLLMVVYLASYLAEKKDLIVSEQQKIGRWRLPSLAYVGPLLAMFGLTTVLLAWQQDLGTAMLFFFTFLSLLYLATGEWKYITTGLALFLIAGLAGYYLSDRIALRVDGWLNPWPDATDRAFQIVQSLLAFGAGGIFGQGLGLGAPTYIPAVHTDFVFAAIGEEFGLVGALASITLYGLLLLRGSRIVICASRSFERLLAAGLTVSLIIQAWIIIAGNVKLAPIAGVTLPFISYGGSSMLTSFIALALLLRVSSLKNKTFMGKSPNLWSEFFTPAVTSRLFRLTGVLIVALILLSATCGYWAVLRAQALRTRDDNPRRVIYEQQIVRGRILDRSGTVLADVEKLADGSVKRRYPVPQAAPAVGYASLRYGVSGIEAAFDAHLRGEAGRSVWQSAWEKLIHRPPQGRDVQLTLDTMLQIQAQQELEGRAGAIVLLEAASGEILALASSPTFDSRRLDETWEELIQDPSAPLVNRATQSLYQPGAALQTIIIAEALNEGLTTLAAHAPHAMVSLPINGVALGCSKRLSEPTTLAQAYAAACPAPFADLGERLGAAGLERAIGRWVLFVPSLQMEIPTESAGWNTAGLSTTTSQRIEAIGQGKLTVSPLQMALVAATLANEGEMPAPRLTLRIQDTHGTWCEHPSKGAPHSILTSDRARDLLEVWRRCKGYSSSGQEEIVAHWGIAIAGEEQAPHIWFLGVAPANDPRYAIAVLLEHTDVSELAVADIGAELLQAASHRMGQRSR